MRLCSLLSVETSNLYPSIFPCIYTIVDHNKCSHERFLVAINNSHPMEAFGGRYSINATYYALIYAFTTRCGPFFFVRFFFIFISSRIPSLQFKCCNMRENVSCEHPCFYTHNYFTFLFIHTLQKIFDERTSSRQSYIKILLSKLNFLTNVLLIVLVSFIS